MAYVPVPKDLSKIKTKLAFNLTKRQLVCFSSAAAVGLPAYLFSRGSIGNSAAMFLMIGLMLPFFFLAMYERDGLPLEKVLKNIIRTRFLYPRVRPYKTENFYALLSARKEAQPIAKQQKGRKARRQKAGKAGPYRPVHERKEHSHHRPADPPLPGNVPGRGVPGSGPLLHQNH